MKTYLLQFRDEVFSGALSLTKRTILPNMLVFLIIALFSMTILMPFYMQALGLGFGDYKAYQNLLMEMQEALRSGEQPSEVFPGLFGQMNYSFLFLLFLLGLIFYAWIFNIIFNINDQEIRHGSRNPLRAISASFNSGVFRILFYFILNTVAFVAILIVYGLLIAAFGSMSGALGALAGFLGYFAVLAFFLRFSLGIPAIVHGKMSAIEAWSFSYKQIGWKRAFIILLILIALMILVFLVMLAFLPFLSPGAQTGAGFILIQLIMLIFSVLLSSFGASSLSALYFRYSSDQTDSDNASEHLIATQ